MLDQYIIQEPEMKQFREIYFNPDAECGAQFVEQVYSYDLIVRAYHASKNNEEFANIIDSDCKTYLYDNGTPEYNNMVDFIQTLSSYTYVAKDRILMASAAIKETSTCKDCVHHARCEAVYEQIDGRSCKDDLVDDCDFFIAQSMIH